MLADWAAAGMTGRRNVRVINGSAGAVPVSADREMIRRLLLILLDNAVKYSPENSQVTVRVLKEDKGCRIEVEDQGIGIDEKDIPHIFERFYRADKTRSRQTAGTGLGLSIAMEIAERHGGGIEVKSTPGKGSLFVVRLPDD
jgi:signal transduction histidine kinase